ncbi:LysR substrate-binding domain-containing protein [Aliikangiella coralliicola]|uniref:LysR family transcriptional regulator n=1 Tax=Aliikangiella coralliicola TaxID=2592383 RepID=A0A545UHA8_9GAMM|nr:LysR substrate-binding domain-containing protein [Aliikangiella coralliicola]TQV88850.1 LysR family transcriptional regulator [Aliikangiella coralliicola]
MRALPPLNSLKAFEATARLNGVQKASEELHVTHGAVSRHIKQLESWLNTSLFTRKGRTLELTDAGQQYLTTISAAFNMIDEGTRFIQSRRQESLVRVTTTHSIANKWLVKKLADFYKKFPQIEIWLTLEQRLSELSQSNIDLAIRMGQGPWPGLNCTPLKQDRLIPVCSPGLIEKQGSLSSHLQLKEFPLLHDRDPNAQWSRWLRENKIKNLILDKGSRFASGDLLIEAAIDGQGIALISEWLATDALNNHQLIQPLKEFVDLGFYFWLVTPQDHFSNPSVNTFVKWLRSVV